MSLPRMSKEEFAKLMISLETDPIYARPMKWGPRSKKKATAPPPETSAADLKREIVQIAMADISDEAQIVPIDASAVAAQKATITLGGEVPSITVRAYKNGRFALLDGHAVVAALRELGRSRVHAIAVFGLSDLDAKIWRLNSCVRSKLPVLDKAIVYKQLAEAVKEKVAQLAPPGGQQPNEMYMRKVAKALNLGKDHVRRAIKIGGITVEVQQEVRKKKMENNQTVLMEIANSGETADEQLATLRNLVKQRREKSNEKRMAKNTERSLGGPTIATVTADETRDISFDQVAQEWVASRVYQILAVSSFGIRQRFFHECAAPLADPDNECTSDQA